MFSKTDKDMGEKKIVGGKGVKLTVLYLLGTIRTECIKPALFILIKRMKIKTNTKNVNGKMRTGSVIKLANIRVHWKVHENAIMICIAHMRSLASMTSEIGVNNSPSSTFYPYPWIIKVPLCTKINPCSILIVKKLCEVGL